jgi:nitrogen-specific signal transduction histidine kinase
MKNKINRDYQALEDDFTSTFIHELMPGILHNFANPLNTIMGRSKLLQRRLDNAVNKMREAYPDAAQALKDEWDRIQNDVLSINKESESFLELFRDVSGKFYALTCEEKDRINLSQLLAAEMRFANFYLEFKHHINKEIRLDMDTPDLEGNRNELSLAFWMLIRFAMSSALESEPKGFFLETRHDQRNIIVFIKYSGKTMPGETVKFLNQYPQSGDAKPPSVKMEKGVLYAVTILKTYSMLVQFSTDDCLNAISIIIPYQITNS